jgi:hypothetical protein
MGELWRSFVFKFFNLLGVFGSDSFRGYLSVNYSQIIVMQFTKKCGQEIHASSSTESISWVFAEIA